MLKTILIFSLISFVSFFQINSCDKSETPKNKNTSNIKENRKSPTNSNSKKTIEIKEDSAKENTKNFLSISKLNKAKPKKGVLETKGYVAKTTNCKACPPDAQCKPCMAENILISEDNKTLDKYELTNKEMIIFTKESEKFTIGKEYKFRIKITDKKTTSTKLNDVELISSEPIKN